MSTLLYILRDHQPVPEPDAATWSAWFDDYEHRKVARTYLGDGTIGIYTSFLGMDHNFSETGPPLLFETMVEDVRTGEWWDEQWRYSAWDSAREGHDKMVAYVMEKLQHA